MKDNESNEEELHPYKSYIDAWTMFDCIRDIIHREQCTLAKQINESFSTEIEKNQFRYIGGLDISYPIEDPNVACGCCVVYDTSSKAIVYSDCIMQTITVPYIPGFLAYREMSVYRILLNKLKDSSFWTSIFLVDGNGKLHPRHFGSACAIGLEYNCVTIGVSKNPFCGEAFLLPANSGHCSNDCIDVCSEVSRWKERIRNGFSEKRSIPIEHYGEVIGAAYCSPNHSNPIYISVGNNISLDQAISIVSSLCIYRIPEPIRVADHLSREFLRNKFKTHYHVYYNNYKLELLNTSIIEDSNLSIDSWNCSHF